MSRRSAHAPSSPLPAIKSSRPESAGVKEVATKGMPLPSMIVIPLARDGCVDCEVDEEEAIRMIRLGCGDCEMPKPTTPRRLTPRFSAHYPSPADVT